MFPTAEQSIWGSAAESRMIKPRLTYIPAVFLLLFAACSFDRSGVNPMDDTDGGPPPIDAGIDANPLECVGQSDGTPCGDPTDTECDGADTCLNEQCEDNLVAVDTACGDSTDDECTDPDTCDGAGTCLPNHEPMTTTCGDNTDDECTNPDTCDGAGVCAANHEAAATPCGDNTDDECTNPDACDGAGTCLPNHEAVDTPCGDNSDDECTNPDACDGAGTCLPNHEAVNTPCGDNGTTDCTNPDTCDGAGACDDNHNPNNGACDDCMAGMGFCDSCQSGICENIPCDQNNCFIDGDCAAGATSDTCVDAMDDCVAVACVGGTPSMTIEGGAPAGTDFNTWQSGDDNTNINSNVSYCNATMPISGNGVLTSWTFDVDGFGSNGEAAQLTVVRCTSGSGGNGPPYTDCIRVGRGPTNQTISGNGVNTFSLAGSSQLDGAPDDATGIVVEAGDLLCTDSEFFSLSVDCNGSSTVGGCAGAPLMDVQYVINIDSVVEPFDLADSARDGVLMIMGTGTTYAIAGQCSDVEPVADTTLCNDGGGDTCCAGACVVGPNGAGTCN